MSKWRRPWWLLALLLFTACRGSIPQSPPALPPPEHLANSAYTVHGDFLRFYQTYGGVESLGQPLTDEIIVEGWRVQYFEKGRLELHPENEPAYRITVGWLGELLQRRQPPLPVVVISRGSHPNQRYFPETGHTLSGDFLTYFEAHGDTVRFGRPISEPFISQGRLTQDFQSARFYWSPTAALPVTLENIGETHLKRLDLNPAQ